MVRIPRISTDPAVRDTAIRLTRRADTTLEIREFSRSRADTLRGALVSDGPDLEDLAGFFLFWFGRSMTLASSLELPEFLEPFCKHRRSPSSL